MQNSGVEKVEVCPSIHLSLDKFQPIKSGKKAVLLPLPPLRTRRETFASYRSSLSNVCLMLNAASIPLTSDCELVCDIPGAAELGFLLRLYRRDFAR